MLQTMQKNLKKVNSAKKQQNGHNLSQPNALHANILPISEVANKHTAEHVVSILTYLKIQLPDMTQP